MKSVRILGWIGAAVSFGVGMWAGAELYSAEGMPLWKVPIALAAAVGLFFSFMAIHHGDDDDDPSFAG